MDNPMESPYERFYLVWSPGRGYVRTEEDGPRYSRAVSNAFLFLSKRGAMERARYCSIENHIVHVVCTFEEVLEKREDVEAWRRNRTRL